MSATADEFRWRKVAQEDVPEAVVVLVFDAEDGAPRLAVRDGHYLLDACGQGAIEWNDDSWWTLVPPPPSKGEAR